MTQTPDNIIGPYKYTSVHCMLEQHKKYGVKLLFVVQWTHP